MVEFDEVVEDDVLVVRLGLEIVVFVFFVEVVVDEIFVIDYVVVFELFLLVVCSG